MKQIILPIEQPIIDTFPKYENLTFVICSKESYMNWIYNNFIQIKLNTSYFKKKMRNKVLLDFYEEGINEDNCPFLDIQKIESVFIMKGYGCLVNFAKEAIDNKCYMMMKLDTYYIPFYKSYKKEHKRHIVFVYGYSDKTEELYIGDNFSVDSGKYSFKTISFQQANDAFEGAMTSKLNKDNRLTKIHSLFSLKEPMEDHKINSIQIKQMLKDYLTGEDNINRFYSAYKRDNSSFKYGIDCYDEILDGIKHKMLDLRMFHLIISHKRLMLNRINILNNSNKLNNYDGIIEMYKEVYSICLIIQDAAVKFLLTKKKDLLVKLVTKIIELKAIDKKAVEMLIEGIIE